MENKADVWQGTLALMVLKTLETMGPLHGYGIARRIEQTSGDRAVAQLRNPVSRVAEAGAGGLDRLRMGRFGQQSKSEVLRLTRAGRKQLEREARDWAQTTAILARFLSPGEERT